MTTDMSPRETIEPRSIRALRVLWRFATLPLYALLAILEPIVIPLLCLCALLGVLTSLLWRFAAPPSSHFPFWTMIGLSLGFFFVAMLYYVVLRLVAPRQ